MWPRSREFSRKLFVEAYPEIELELSDKDSRINMINVREKKKGLVEKHSWKDGRILSEGCKILKRSK